MSSKNIINLLNEQMNLEFYSSNLYLQISAWCEYKGYLGAAKFLSTHAAEEMQHMRKLFNYLNEIGAETIVDAIQSPKIEFSSLKQVVEDIYHHEKLITQKINNLVDKAFEEKNFPVFNFLQWYVAEQHEEEKLFRGILNKFDLIGEDSKSIYFIDKELASL